MGDATAAELLRHERARDAHLAEATEPVQRQLTGAISFRDSRSELLSNLTRDGNPVRRRVRLECSCDRHSVDGTKQATGRIVQRLD
jgi:hypothetical protein